MTKEPKTTEDVDLDEFYQALGIPEGATRILRSAMELFARKGYAATSVREIVQEANVTNPMLYYYFDSKEGLFTRLIDILFGAINLRVAQVLADEHLPFAERLRQLLDVHLDAVSEAPEALRFVYSVLFGPRESRPDFDPLARREESFAGVVQLFERAIARGEFTPHDGFTPHFLAEQLFGMINQHLMHTLASVECARDDDTRDACLDELLGEDARRNLMRFYFAGAGQLNGPQKETSR